MWADCDPILFPTEAKDEVLAKLPPIIQICSEFDYFLYSQREFAERLKKHNKLLEHIEYPGGSHGFYFYLHYKQAPQFYKDINKCLDAYVR